MADRSESSACSVATTSSRLDSSPCLAMFHSALAAFSTRFLVFFVRFVSSPSCLRNPTSSAMLTSLHRLLLCAALHMYAKDVRFGAVEFAGGCAASSSSRVVVVVVVVVVSSTTVSGCAVLVLLVVVANARVASERESEGEGEGESEGAPIIATTTGGP